MNLYKLYEVNKHLEILMADIDRHINEETGEIESSFSDELDKLQIDRDEMVLSCACEVKNLTHTVLNIDAEISRLQKRKKRCTAISEKIGEHIKRTVSEGEKLANESASISWRKSERLVIDAGIEFDDIWLRVKTEPNKEVIKDAIKRGVNIVGCRIQEVNNLIIK